MFPVLCILLSYFTSERTRHVMNNTSPCFCRQCKDAQPLCCSLQAQDEVLHLLIIRLHYNISSAGGGIAQNISVLTIPGFQSVCVSGSEHI